MITKERLQELIEKGATIWVKGSVFIFKFELNKTYYIEDNYLMQSYCEFDDDVVIKTLGDLQDLFETEEDARWELEMTATYTNTLKLANYTNFENENGDRVFYHKGTTYELSLWWTSDNTKIIRVTWSNKDGFGWLFEKPLTKENYIEACKLCLRLFEGE